MRFLIVKLSSVGDVIHAMPVAAALKKKWQNAKISWVVEPAAKALLENHRYIDEIIVFEKKKKTNLEYLALFIKLLRKQRYDFCIDLQGLFKSAAIVFFARAARKIGWYNLREGSWLVSKRTQGAYRNAHVVERYLDVPRVLGIELPEGTADFGIGFSEPEKTAARSICIESGLDIEKDRLVVLAPGSIWQTKCWPARYFGELAACFAENGITPVIVGAPNETSLAEELISAFSFQLSAIPPKSIVNLVGKTSLKELAYIISKAKVFVGNDSGPVHLAAAVGTRVIVLFGPSKFRRTGPYGNNNVVLQTVCERKECMQRVCSLGKECMADISADLVYSRFLEG
ncbi:MAG: lipopolysaccharide heptosyltransferase II [Negativicutes bacterium]|jgi:heptosyltransferase-1